MHCKIAECDKEDDMSWKTFVSHAYRIHKLKSKDLAGKYEVVGMLNAKTAVRIEDWKPPRNPFAAAKSKKVSKQNESAPASAPAPMPQNNTNPDNQQSHVIVNDEQEDDDIDMNSNTHSNSHLPSTSALSASAPTGLSVNTGFQQQMPPRTRAHLQSHPGAAGVQPVHGGLGVNPQQLSVTAQRILKLLCLLRSVE